MPRAAHLNESLASAEKMIRNIEAILKAAGSGLDRIIKTTVGSDILWLWDRLELNVDLFHRFILRRTCGFI
jgi:Putative translation initiation inhibitor, yjgF family